LQRHMGFLQQNKDPFDSGRHTLRWQGSPPHPSSSCCNWQSSIW
jgi:hypothetical protein